MCFIDGYGYLTQIQRFAFQHDLTCCQISYMSILSEFLV
ncbi:hypothetical protein APHMUC_1203 [Anaplasma phagocytophilum str. ApMUC09]|uniref:Uncharacterized protein n=1 Tax=Anaplasma phagocytophilum str. ApMUC09 TaxID=1359152 RepID=A0A0F3NAQ4_ANAPH|nr:hypothetical protein APHMUC_1203 [Anaplasma phagocytophilum str. ApMUC09]